MKETYKNLVLISMVSYHMVNNLISWVLHHSAVALSLRAKCLLCCEHIYIELQKSKYNLT